MTVADRLGESSSFGKARNHRRSDRGRAKAISEGAIPEYEIVRLMLDEVSPTPLNPRKNFGTDQEKTELGESLRKKQISPCIAVSRAAYLALWPEHDAELTPEATVVLVAGERRWRSGKHVGLEALDFVVRDDIAVSREEFIDTLLKENIDREDFDLMERAHGIASLVEVCGGNQSAAAARLNRDRSFITNQLILLTLPAEIQRMLSSKEMPERDGRLLARRLKDSPGATAEDLLQFLQAEKDRVRRNKEEDRQLLAAAREAQVLSADNTRHDRAEDSDTSGSAQTPTTERSVLSADNTPPRAEPSSQAGMASQSNGADGVLSADNTASAPSEPSVSDLPGTETEDATLEPDVEVLSADNTQPGVTPLTDRDVSSPSINVPHQPAAPPLTGAKVEDITAMADELCSQLTREQLHQLTQILSERLATSRA